MKRVNFKEFIISIVLANFVDFACKREGKQSASEVEKVTALDVSGSKSDWQILFDGKTFD